MSEEMISVFGTVGLALLGYGSMLLRRWVSSRVESERLASILDRLTRLAEMVVRDMYQNYVEAAKAEGAFNKDAARIAKAEGIDMLKNYLGPRGVQALIHVVGAEDQLDKLLGSAIESAIINEKNRP